MEVRRPTEPDRRAARTLVAEYHEKHLAELHEHVRDGFSAEGEDPDWWDRGAPRRRR